MIDDTGKQIIINLLRDIDNYSLRDVEDACKYLGHPEDPDDGNHRCFCREMEYFKPLSKLVSEHIAAHGNH